MQAAGEHDLAAIAAHVDVLAELARRVADGLGASEVQVEGAGPAGVDSDCRGQFEARNVGARVYVDNDDAAGLTGAEPDVPLPSTNLPR